MLKTLIIMMVGLFIVLWVFKATKEDVKDSINEIVYGTRIAKRVLKYTSRVLWLCIIVPISYTIFMFQGRSFRKSQSNNRDII